MYASLSQPCEGTMDISNKPLGSSNAYQNHMERKYSNEEAMLKIMSKRIVASANTKPV